MRPLSVDAGAWPSLFASRPDADDGIPSEPGHPPSGWQLLGYDVGDRWLLSGLCNCGWEPGEIRPPAAWSAAALNEHHLFRDPDPAFGFAEITSLRVPEHAPFFVYSLYRLPA